MENLDKAVYTQSDDRFIPPSVTDQKCSLNDNNEQVQTTFKNEISKYETTNNVNDIKKPEDNFVLSVENLGRVKKEREIMTEQMNESHNTATDSTNLNMRTSSPTVKLEVKSESNLITDALIPSHKDEISHRFDIKSSSVKLDSEEKVTMKKDKEQNSANDSHLSSKKSNKSESNNHKSEKENKDKTVKEHR